MSLFHSRSRNLGRVWWAACMRPLGFWILEMHLGLYFSAHILIIPVHCWALLRQLKPRWFSTGRKKYRSMLLGSLKPHTASPKLQDLQNQLILPVPQETGNSKSHLLPKWGSYSLLMKCLQGEKLPQPPSSPQCFESSPICSTYTYEFSQAKQNSRLREERSTWKANAAQSIPLKASWDESAWGWCCPPVLTTEDLEHRIQYTICQMAA